MALDCALGICCVRTNSPPVKSLSGSFKNKTVELFTEPTSEAIAGVAGIVVKYGAVNP